MQRVVAAGDDITADVVGVVRLLSATERTCRARMRSRKPGANRSICASICAVALPV
jgi:hypothetical protein